MSTVPPLKVAVPSPLMPLAPGPLQVMVSVPPVMVKASLPLTPATLVVSPLLTKVLAELFIVMEPAETVRFSSLTMPLLPLAVTVRLPLPLNTSDPSAKRAAFSSSSLGVDV